MQSSLENIATERSLIRRKRLRRTMYSECQSKLKKSELDFNFIETKVNSLFALYQVTNDVNYLHQAKELIFELEANKLETKRLQDFALFLIELESKCTDAQSLSLIIECKRRIRLLIQIKTESRLKQLKQLIIPIYYQPTISIDIAIINC